MSKKPTLELNPTDAADDSSAPSAQLIRAAASEATVVAENGLTIKLKKPGILAQFRLVKILGDSAKNQVYMSMVLPLIYVVDIDGEPVFQPKSEREVEALIVRLDDAGVEAVMKGVQETFGTADPDSDKDELKN